MSEEINKDAIGTYQIRLHKWVASAWKAKFCKADTWDVCMEGRMLHDLGIDDSIEAWAKDWLARDKRLNKYLLNETLDKEYDPETMTKEDIMFFISIYDYRIDEEAAEELRKDENAWADKEHRPFPTYLVARHVEYDSYKDKTEMAEKIILNAELASKTYSKLEKLQLKVAKEEIRAKKINAKLVKFSENKKIIDEKVRNSEID